MARKHRQTAPGLAALHAVLVAEVHSSVDPVGAERAAREITAIVMPQHCQFCGEVAPKHNPTCIAVSRERRH